MPRVLRLEPLAQAVSSARAHVRDMLPGLRGELVRDNAELAVSELVTNATLHARTPMTVEVFRTLAGAIRITVRDGSTLVPTPRRYALTATTGRGLRLVEAVSDAWGFDPLSVQDGPGKVVWCEPAADARELDPSDEWADVIAALA